MELLFAAATDPGLVRRRNEDRFVAEADLGFFVVVDGMAGHASGERGDRIILCSDGIHGVLTDAELAGLAAAEARPLQEICDALIQQANGRGGSDNATAVVIEVRGTAD